MMPAVGSNSEVAPLLVEPSGLLILGPSFWLPHAAITRADVTETMRSRRISISFRNANLYGRQCVAGRTKIGRYRSGGLNRSSVNEFRNVNIWVRIILLSIEQQLCCNQCFNIGSPVGRILCEQRQGHASAQHVFGRACHLVAHGECGFCLDEWNGWLNARAQLHGLAQQFFDARYASAMS